MRKYLCCDCQHTWSIIFGDEAAGVNQACPICKGLNVKRTDHPHDISENSKQIPGNRSEKTSKQQD